MKVVWKLTAALISGTVLVLGSNGFLRVHREIAQLHADRVHDHALVGRALGAAVAAIWRSDGKRDALRVVEAANQHEGVVHIKWLEATDASRARVDGLRLAALPVGETVTRLVPTEAGDMRFSYTPVDASGDRLGFVELSETLDAERRTARTIVTDTLVTTLMMIIVSAALAGVLGLWLVGRPVDALCAKARRIGAGDFARPLVLRQRDELGLLAREMNATCERLAEAAERVARETSARIATMEQLRHVDRLTTVGKLASGVAHELGTPLNIVAARAKMIACGDTTPAETTEYAQIIADASDRMTKIIRQLLTFARRKPTTKSRCDLRRVASDTIELLRPVAEKSNVRIRVHAPETAAIADVDGDAIQQVLTNIFVNAMHAMPHGGEVDVGFSYEDRPPAGEHPGRHLVIRVRDHGEGISPEDQAHIFEPFFTTKEVGSGTGLGLSVTHGIVEDHGGFIDVESEPGQGSVFSIHLPARSAGVGDAVGEVVGATRP